MGTTGKFSRKPRTYGATPLRVVMPLGHGGTEFFYDIREAEAFVRENWVAGHELSARVQNGGVWDPVFGITEDGTIYVSPSYDTIKLSATRIIGKM